MFHVVTATNWQEFECEFDNVHSGFFLYLGPGSMDVGGAVRLVVSFKSVGEKERGSVRTIKITMVYRPVVVMMLPKAGLEMAC